MLCFCVVSVVCAVFMCCVCVYVLCLCVCVLCLCVVFMCCACESNNTRPPCVGAQLLPTYLSDEKGL